MKRFAQVAFLACFLAVILAVPAGTLLFSKNNTSAYYENRALAEWPEITAEGILDGSLAQSLETWYSDHAPGRATLLKMDTFLSMDVLHRPVVNDIVTTQDVLVPFLDYSEYTPAAYEATVSSMSEPFSKLNQYIEETGGSFYFVGFPEQRIYFEDEFPDYLNNHENEAEAADTIFREALEDEGIAFLDMGEVYDDLGHPADFYSAVDHHYNYYGAYAAYRSILDTLAADGWDLPVLTEEDFTFRELPNPYIGSRNRKLYNLWPNQDRAVIAEVQDPVAYTRYDNGEPSDKPLYVLPAAEDLPTTYNLYMGGDFGETILETNRPELPDVLVFGDSFTNALETLLYNSFDEMRSLDLRHYTDKTLRDYIADYQPDIVICVMNDTFYYTPTGNGNVWPEE